MSPDVLDGIIRQTARHGLRDGDANKHLLPILAKWRASLRLSKRKSKARDPRFRDMAPFACWSTDIHEWPVRSYPHHYKYFAIFHERKHHLRFVFLLKNVFVLWNLFFSSSGGRSFFCGKCTLFYPQVAAGAFF